MYNVVDTLVDQNFNSRQSPCSSKWTLIFIGIVYPFPGPDCCLGYDLDITFTRVTCPGTKRISPVGSMCYQKQNVVRLDTLGVWFSYIVKVFSRYCEKTNLNSIITKTQMTEWDLESTIYTENSDPSRKVSKYSCTNVPEISSHL